MVYSAIKTFSTKLLHHLANCCVLQYILQLIMICLKRLKQAGNVQTLNLWLTVNRGSLH